MKNKNKFSKKDRLKIINTCVACFVQLLIMLQYPYTKHPYVAIPIIILGITLYIYSSIRLIHLIAKKYYYNENDY